MSVIIFLILIYFQSHRGPLLAGYIEHIHDDIWEIFIVSVFENMMTRNFLHNSYHKLKFCEEYSFGISELD